MEILVVPATLDSLKRIREFVVAAAQSAGLSRKAAYRLRLGVDEIATNAIEHGDANGDAAPGCEQRLHISAAIDDQTLKIIFEDQGKPYDPHQTPRNDNFTLPLEKRQTGGLGIYLTLQGIDEFFYERAEGWNRTTFIMKR